MNDMKNSISRWVAAIFNGLATLFDLIAIYFGISGFFKIIDIVSNPPPSSGFGGGPAAGMAMFGGMIFVAVQVIIPYCLAGSFRRIAMQQTETIKTD